MGIDPATHKPRNNPASLAQSRQHADLSHMAQWEAARLEAEARLARESKHVYKLPLLHKLTSPSPPPPTRHLAAPPCLDVLKVWQSTAIPSCFFSSPASCSSLESPTSTLNFSCNSLTAPVAAANDTVAADGYGACVEAEGETDNSHPLHDAAYTSSYDCGLADLAAFDQDSDGYGGMDGGNSLPLVGEFEESKDYWNYLLNLVTSPVTEPPPALWG